MGILKMDVSKQLHHFVIGTKNVERVIFKNLSFKSLEHPKAWKQNF